MKSSMKEETLENFKRNILKLKKKENFHEEEFSITVLKYAILLIVFTDVFWLIYNSTTNKYGMMSVIAVAVQIILSLGMFMVVVYRDKLNNTQFRITNLIFYVSIVTTCTLINIDYDMIEASSGGSGRLLGVPISSFYLFVILLAPIGKILDMVIIFIAIIISYFIPFLLPSGSYYPAAEQMIIRIYFIVMYIAFSMFKKQLKRNSDHVERLNEDLINVSYTDALTSTMNKRALYKYLEYLSFNPEIHHVGSCIFDIDDFKSYNDHYSHLKGDGALQKVCEEAMGVLKEEEAYLFRYGGEEFAFFLVNTTEEKLKDVAMKIRNAVVEADIERHDNGNNCITITLGCAIEETVRRNDADYVLSADKELYIGKNNGKNCVVLNDSIYR